jgi:tetratricopeptide (TPR) repeat protein
MKNIVAILFLCLSISSCGQRVSKNEKPPKECIRLNDEGVKYLMKPPIGGMNQADTAISFFKEAIHCDSNYVTAFIGLAGAYERKHDFKSEMLAYNKLLALTNNYPGFIVQKAILFEKLNEVDSAKKNYAIAAAGYSKKLSISANDIDAIKGLIGIKALTVGKDEAISELNKQIKIHPDIAAKLNDERFFYESFDRKTMTGRSDY